MPVFDQYEVEPASSYSGSYTDNAFFGDVIVNTNILSRGYTQLGQPNPKTSRRVITSKTTGEGTTSPTINRMWMPGYLFEGYASGSFLGRCQRFQSFFSNEYWYDSYVPNAIDIYLADNDINATLVGIVSQSFDYGNTYTTNISGSDFSIYSYPNEIFGVSPPMQLSLLEKYAPVSPVPGVLGNRIWPYSFPFESKYKFINRLELFSSTLPINYSISEFVGPGLTPLSATPPSQSNTIGALQIIGESGINYYIGSMKYPTLKYPPTAFTEASFKMGTINPYTFYNAFFGIGFGGIATKSGVGENKPWYVDTNKFFGIVPFNILSYVIPRGYKHGIRSVAPEQTKLTYRIGRYGQNRDMLEGRPYTTSLIPGGFDPYTGAPINRTLDYPLQITYVSGTLIYSQSRDYVTATNPSYNPYDSGIYDIYYRSGKPFFDRENED